MLNPDIVLDAVCAESGLTRRQLRSASRLYRIVAARMLVMLLLYREGYHDSRIAFLLDRARCTVTLQRHRAMGYLATDKLFLKRYESLKQTIEDAKRQPSTQSL